MTRIIRPERVCSGDVLGPVSRVAVASLIKPYRGLVWPIGLVTTQTSDFSTPTNRFGHTSRVIFLCLAALELGVANAPSELDFVPSIRCSN